ncbi:speckle-type POZ protein-like [Musca autumnalis]|uniref:speckle-type POZ protein-like n=1 Tax=Musca autumnalis TaxID=221902 RepID=UPI003CEF869A
MSSTNADESVMGTIEKIRDNQYIWRTPLPRTGSYKSAVVIVDNYGIRSQWKLIVRKEIDGHYSYLFSIKMISSNSRNAQFSFAVMSKGSSNAKNGPMSVLDNPNMSLSLLTKSDKIELDITVNAKAPKIADDFAKILSSEEYSDVTLVAQGGVTFKAHKMVLCTRSEIFAAMFRNDLEESRKNRIEIDDMDANVMKEMLTNIYTDSEIPKEMAAKLFCVAHKYALFNLQQMCEKMLIDAIGVDSVADILLLAEKHSSESLKTAAVEFIIENIKEVNGTEGWRKLRETYLELYVEILEKTLEQRL